MLLDGDLPERAAMRLCEELCSRDEPPRVVVLSFSSEPERIVDAVRSGATAWVGKNESLQHLLEVIRGVARGETWLPPAEAGRVLQLLIRAHDHRSDNTRRLPAHIARVTGGAMRRLCRHGRASGPALPSLPSPGVTAGRAERVAYGICTAHSCAAAAPQVLRAQPAGHGRVRCRARCQRGRVCCARRGGYHLHRRFAGP